MENIFNQTAGKSHRATHRTFTHDVFKAAIARTAILITSMMVPSACSSGIDDNRNDYEYSRNILKIGVMSFDIANAGVYCDKKNEGYSFVFSTEYLPMEKALGKKPEKHALCLDVPFADMDQEFLMLPSVPDGVDWHFTFETCFNGECSGFYAQDDIRFGNMEVHFSGGMLRVHFLAATKDGNAILCEYAGRPKRAYSYIWDFRNDKTNTRLMDGKPFVDLGCGELWAACNLDDESGQNRWFQADDADAASRLWGPKWRTPGQEEWVRMIAACKWEWTQVKGQNGFKGTSVHTGESIFLPACGYLDDEGVNIDSGEYGDYGTSTAAANGEKVYLYFHESASVPLFSTCDPQDRNSIRPVMSP